MDPRRLENEDEEKFWEAWIKDELTFCYRYGKIGSPGGTKLKKFKTAAEAQAELEEKLQQKLAEGFVEIGAEEEEEADEAEEDEADADEKREEDEAVGEDASADAGSEDDDSEDDDSDDGDSDDDDSDDDDSDDDDSDDDDSDDDDSDDDDSDDDEGARAKISEPPPPPPPPKPTLPLRVVPRGTPSPEAIEAAKTRLENVAKALGGRSWRVRRRTRAARHALERLGGLDPGANATLAPPFASLMAQVIAPKKRLPLEAAVSLLWEIDAAAVARTVSGWRAKMLSSPASLAIGVLAAAFDAVPDPEVALHAGAALVDRRLPAAAWERRFAKVVPFLEQSLATKGSTVAHFLATLHPEGDPTLQARVLAAGSVKGSVTLEPPAAAKVEQKPAEKPATKRGKR